MSKYALAFPTVYCVGACRWLVKFRRVSYNNFAWYSQVSWVKKIAMIESYKWTNSKIIKFPLYGNRTGNWFTNNLLMRVRPTKSIKFARDHFQKHWHGKEWKFVHYTWCEWHNRREQVKAESSKEQSESPSRSVIVIPLLLLGCNPQQTFCECVVQLLILHQTHAFFLW